MVHFLIQICAYFFLFFYRPPFTANASFANQQPQWNTSSENDFDMNSSTGSQTPKMSNNQKAAERMAEDESKFEIQTQFHRAFYLNLQLSFSELGEMSTISAVLYANQNHPELKVEFPNWPDRYKQIMKKWRALAPDMKQPYLQRARDNRSAQQAQLRTKKAQQVIIIHIFFKSERISYFPRYIRLISP